MGIRVQPADIEISDQDPFKNDLLGRKEPVEVLTNLLRSIDGPCVLAVDGAWGAGKTTFLKILSRYLRNHGFRVIEFNAWETDFAGDPFVALSQELNDGLRQQHPSGSLPSRLDEMKSAAGEVLRRALPGTIRIATAGLLDLSPLLEKEAGQALASYAQARLDNYLAASKSLRTFTASLGHLASALADDNNGLPLVVVIDELDRCRPSYAVELLETAKHFFTVDRVVFVLAVNRSQLAHSIRAVYGSEFDALGYLRRFFDIDFRLPDTERRPFVEATLKATGIDDYLQGRSEHHNYNTVRDWLATFFDAFHVSPRTIAQAVHHLGLVLASLREGRRSHVEAATLALILRTIDPDRYRRFTRGELEDREAVEFLLGGRLASEDIKCYLEAVIIVAAMEVRNPAWHYPVPAPSPHFRGYMETVDKIGQDGDGDETVAYKQRVVGAVNSLTGGRLLRGSELGFNEAVRRLELTSPSLNDSESPT